MKTIISSTSNGPFYRRRDLLKIGLGLACVLPWFERTEVCAVNELKLDAEMMQTTLRTQTIEEDQFLEFIINLMNWDTRYEPIIRSAFLWAQAKTEYHYQYFVNALKKQAPEIQEEWEMGLQLDESAIVTGLATRVMPGFGTPLNDLQRKYITYVVKQAKAGVIPPSLVVRVYNRVTQKVSFWKKYFSLQPRFIEFQQELEEYILARRIRWNPPI